MFISIELPRRLIRDARRSSAVLPPFLRRSFVLAMLLRATRTTSRLVAIDSRSFSLSLPFFFFFHLDHAKRRFRSTEIVPRLLAKAYNGPHEISSREFSHARETETQRVQSEHCNSNPNDKYNTRGRPIVRRTRSYYLGVTLFEIANSIG